MLHDEVAKEETGPVFACVAVDQDATTVVDLGCGKLIGLANSGHGYVVVAGERRFIGGKRDAGISYAMGLDVFPDTMLAVIDRDNGADAASPQGRQVPRFGVRADSPCELALDYPEEFVQCFVVGCRFRGRLIWLDKERHVHPRDRCEEESPSVRVGDYCDIGGPWTAALVGRSDVGG